MNKKNITILLLFILLISVCSILIINQLPELTASWTGEFKVLFKQYIKVVAFASVFGIVYLRLRKTKEESLETEYNDDEIEEDLEIKK